MISAVSVINTIKDYPSLNCKRRHNDNKHLRPFRLVEIKSVVGFGVRWDKRVKVNGLDECV